MNLDTNQLKQLCSTASEAALKAGELISQYSGKYVHPLNKVGGDSEASQVVTEVDHKAQDIILEILNPSISEFDLGLLTEENDDNQSRLIKDYFWCIDPMDGTLPFIERTTGYSVSIALVSKSGDSVMGVVYEPFSRNIYTAYQGSGAFKNQKPWRPKLEKKHLSFFVDRSFLDHPDFNKVCNELNSWSEGSLEVTQHGGSVINALWALENQPALYFKFPKETNGGGSLWDFAATACIYNELGGFVTDIHGDQLKLNRNDGTFMNEEGILYAMNKDLQTSTLELYKSL